MKHLTTHPVSFQTSCIPKKTQTNYVCFNRVANFSWRLEIERVPQAMNGRVLLLIEGARALQALREYDCAAVMRRCEGAAMQVSSVELREGACFCCGRVSYGECHEWGPFLACLLGSVRSTNCVFFIRCFSWGDVHPKDEVPWCWYGPRPGINPTVFLLFLFFEQMKREFYCKVQGQPLWRRKL